MLGGLCKGEGVSKNTERHIGNAPKSHAGNFEGIVSLEMLKISFPHKKSSLKDKK